MCSLGLCVYPICTVGASGDHVYPHMYPAVSEDFASEDASRLDTWVFDEVKVYVNSGPVFLVFIQKFIIVFSHKSMGAS